jgi:hypothetical protein
MSMTEIDMCSFAFVYVCSIMGQTVCRAHTDALDLSHTSEKKICVCVIQALIVLLLCSFLTDP